MDLWKYFAIGHRDHVLCNPTSEAKIDRLVEVLDLPDAARVLDIACGKAEFLARLARRWRCSGVGVDLSPAFVADARARVKSAGLEARLEIVEGNGAEYAGEPGSFDLATCLGASWIFDGHAGTLRALAGWTRPDGWVVVGEPYWRREPTPAYLEATGFAASSFGSHEQNVRTALDLGLGLLHTIVSDPDDFDRYEGLQWNAIERYAMRHPDDPDAPELVATSRKERDAYLRWGRDTLGWALYVFAKRPFSPDTA